MATLQSAMDIARIVTNDTVVPYARPDSVLLQFGNDALDAIAKVQPHLFHAVVEIACIANKTMQTFNITDSLGYTDILHIKDGNAVTPVERKSLDLFIPEWNAMAAAPAEHWIPVVNDPFRFEVYPPAPAGQVLIGIHVMKPLEYTAGQTHILPDAYTPIIGDYIISQLDAIEDEHAVGGRAKLYFEMFQSSLK